jgi:hypothetical protein
MSKTKVLISLVVVTSLLIGQAGIVLAAPALQEAAPIAGTVRSITIETDPNTAITTVVIEVIGKNQGHQTVRVSQRAAERLGLILLNGDGSPVINNSALGKQIKIELTAVIAEEQPDRHPVADALATFFFEDLSVENDTMYGVIMEAHNTGVSFAAIAQALWLTQQIPEGSLPEIGDKLDVFEALLAAKESGDYAGFTFVDENGSTVTPQNWSQLRKAFLEHKKIGKSNSAPSNQSNDNKDKKNKADKNNKGTGNNQDKQKEK